MIRAQIAVFALGVGAAAVAAPIRAQEGPRLRIAVLDLTGSALQMQSAMGVTGVMTTAINLPAPPGFSAGLTEMLTTTLTRENRFVVLERAKLDRVIAEQDLHMSGRVNPETAMSLGRTIGAQLLIGGDITEFSYQQSSVGSKINIIKNISKQVGATMDRVTAHVAIDLRVVDAVTGEVVSSVRGEGKASNTGVAADLSTASHELAAGATVQTPLGQASRQAIEQAVVLLSASLGKVPWSGRVVDVRGTNVYVNAGNALGIRNGMTLDVYARDSALVDPESGRSLGAPERKVGRLEVIEVTETYAVARVLEGGGFKRNDRARLTTGVAAP